MMVLLLQESVLDVLMNFLALTIITEFDDYMFQTLYDDPISHLIIDGEAVFGGKERKLSDIVKIETTTSHCARFKIEGNRFGVLSSGDKEHNNRLTNRDSRGSYIQ